MDLCYINVGFTSVVSVYVAAAIVKRVGMGSNFELRTRRTSRVAQLCLDFELHSEFYILKYEFRALLK